MVNKKLNKGGWLRLVEASLAIVIVLGVVLSLSISREARKEADLTQVIRPILDEIASDQNLRAKIIECDNCPGTISELNDFVGTKITNPSLGYNVSICKLDDLCTFRPADMQGELYAVERAITSTLSAYGPKKIKLFVWRKAA